MNIKKKTLLVEISWWIVSLGIAILFLIPLKIYAIPYSFYISNVLFIVGAIQFGRWIFLWHFTPYAWSIPFKVFMFFAAAALFFWGLNEFYQFKGFQDEIGLQEILKHLNQKEQTSMFYYIRSQMVFWAISFLICCALVPAKVFWSIWKQLNRNQV